MVITEQYLRDKEFDIYISDDNSFEKYLWVSSVKIGHIDEYDEDLYEEKMICIYKRYSTDDNGNKIFNYTIMLSITNPGLYKESLKFEHQLSANKELTTEYLEGIRSIINI